MRCPWNILRNRRCEEAMAEKQSGGGADLAARFPLPSGACREPPEPSGLAMTSAVRFYDTLLTRERPPDEEPSEEEADQSERQVGMAFSLTACVHVCAWEYQGRQGPIDDNVKNIGRA